MLVCIDDINLSWDPDEINKNVLFIDEHKKKMYVTVPVRRSELLTNKHIYE